jgi:hypothetical protein
MGNLNLTNGEDMKTLNERYNFKKLSKYLSAIFLGLALCSAKADAESCGGVTYSLGDNVLAMSHTSGDRSLSVSLLLKNNLIKLSLLAENKEAGLAKGNFDLAQDQFATLSAEFEVRKSTCTPDSITSNQDIYLYDSCDGGLFETFSFEGYHVGNRGWIYVNASTPESNHTLRLELDTAKDLLSVKSAFCQNNLSSFAADFYPAELGSATLSSVEPTIQKASLCLDSHCSLHLSGNNILYTEDAPATLAREKSPQLKKVISFLDSAKKAKSFNQRKGKIKRAKHAMKKLYTILARSEKRTLSSVNRLLNKAQKKGPVGKKALSKALAKLKKIELINPKNVPL